MAEFARECQENPRGLPLAEYIAGKKEHAPKYHPEPIKQYTGQC